MTDNFLKLENISFSYKNSSYTLFENFSLELGYESNIIGILGPNGCGKTALARILMNLVKLKKGNVYLFGKDFTKTRTTKKIDQISLSTQMMGNSFITNSVEDEISFNNKLKNKLDNKKETNSNFERRNHNFFIDKQTQHPLTLSGGEKRKLNFHLLNILDPHIYILDEPTVGLDFYGIRDLIQEIHRLQTENKKILIISHDLSFLLPLVDSCIILNKDKISKNTVIEYQGSLESYLLKNISKAKEFLNIPIEFSLYYEEILKHNQGKFTSYSDFLLSSEG